MTFVFLRDAKACLRASHERVSDTEKLHNKHERQFHNAFPRPWRRRSVDDTGHFYIDASSSVGDDETHRDADEGSADEVGDVVKSQEDPAEGDEKGPREQRDAELPMIGRKGRRERERVGGVSARKCGLGFRRHA